MPPDQMPERLTHFQRDRECLERTFAAPFSPRRIERLTRFLSDGRAMLEALPFETLSRDDRIDWLLLRSLLDTEERRLRHQEVRRQETEPWTPFVSDLIGLEESRRALEDVAPRQAAERLDTARKAVDALREDSQRWPQSSTLAGRTAQIVTRLRTLLERWFGFYHTYDPTFDWWVETPYRALDQALDEYARALRDRVAGPTGEGIAGEPIGPEALRDELRFAQVPYSPEELIDAAQEEWEWCRAQLELAASAMGHGCDWRAALEQVKSEHVEPGQQPALVRDLALEAIAYVEEHDLVTLPPVARECWQMEMMSAERQKMTPFFLGGETIIVSFPTREMPPAQKHMSLRGNNRHFARATVHHELIPGHHLQLYAMERHRPYRRLFQTAFWIEGWTLHWEMLLWERGFARTPQERIGMLFWRMHRAARIVFSLQFHLGQRTAAQCIDLLVTEACHERDNAVAEVRRSFEGDYEPLYQCAYLVGGWQMHALYREWTGAGRGGDREFHDAVLRANCMPVPMLRALLGDVALDRQFEPAWRFHPLPKGSIAP